MKREWTNRIRFILDELIPPIIRDSRFFMWPFFVVAYGRLSVTEVMNFKSTAYKMTDSEYANFYSSLANSMSRRRITDLNTSCLEFILNSVRERQCDIDSALDVGAGNGFLLRNLVQVLKRTRIAGVDAVQLSSREDYFEFHKGLLPSLPFKDKEFDLLTCTHVIEHVPDIDASINELIRVARKFILVVVPRQRYYRYTIDEHLNFFPMIEPLARKFSPHKVTAHLLGGDWALLVELFPGEGE